MRKSSYKSCASAHGHQQTVDALMRHVAPFATSHGLHLATSSKCSYGFNFLGAFCCYKYVIQYRNACTIICTCVSTNFYSHVECSIVLTGVVSGKRVRLGPLSYDRTRFPLTTPVSTQPHPFPPNRIQPQQVQVIAKTVEFWSSIIKIWRSLCPWLLPYRVENIT